MQGKKRNGIASQIGAILIFKRTKVIFLLITFNTDTCNFTSMTILLVTIENSLKYNLKIRFIKIFRCAIFKLNVTILWENEREGGGVSRTLLTQKQTTTSIL